MLRHGWWVAIVGALVGASIGFATRPSEAVAVRDHAGRAQYRAAHFLVLAPSADGRAASSVAGLDHNALRVVVGRVPKAVLRRLDGTWCEPQISEGAPEAIETGSGSGIRSGASPGFRTGRGSACLVGQFGRVVVTPDPDQASGALTIVATGARTAAVQAANISGDELMRDLERRGVKLYETQLTELMAQRDVAATGGGDPLSIDEEIAMLTATGPVPTVLQTLQRATRADAAALMTSSRAVTNSWLRLVIAGAIGTAGALMILGLVIGVQTGRREGSGV